MRRFLTVDAVVTVGILVTVLAATTARSFLTPLFSSGDEMAHFDYAVQVWHGRLPVFEDGLQVQLNWGTRPPVQWTSQHPPLFYLLLAPVVGPLYDAGHPYIAGMAGRVVNTMIAGALCVAVMWAVRPLTGGRRWIPWIAGLVAAASPWVMGVGSAIYNDDIAALEITVVLGAALRLITLPRSSGIPAHESLWWVLGIAAVCAAGTRLALTPLIFVVFSMLVLRGLAAPGPLSRLGWVLRPTAIGLAMVAATGWFYLRNLRLTGSVTGGHPEWAKTNTERTDPPSVPEVFTDPGYWTKLIGIFSPGNVPGGLTLWGLLVTPAALGLVLALIAAVMDRRLPVQKHDDIVDPTTAARPLLLPGVLLLAGVTLLLVVMQFVYVSREAGNLFPRYSLPVLMVICLLLAWGLGGIRRSVPLLLGLWSAVAWWQLITYLLERPREVSPDHAVVRPELALPLLALATATAAATTLLVIVESQREPRRDDGVRGYTADGVRG